MAEFDELKTEELGLIVRYEQQMKVLEDVRTCFGAAGIEFIALKGAVIRNLYEQPWQRRSADVDLLIKPERLKDAEKALRNLSYDVRQKNSQHMVFYSPSKVMLEVHFTLGDYKRLPRGAEVLENVWTDGLLPLGYKSLPLGCKSGVSEGNATTFKNSEYVMTDEYFYFYHIYHIAKHLISGGVKRRDIYDTYLLNTKVEFDQKKREELLERGGLTRVEKELRVLSCKLYCNSEGNDSPSAGFAPSGYKSGVSGGESGVSVGSNSQANCQANCTEATSVDVLEYYIDHPELMFAANLAFEGKNAKVKYLAMKVFPPVSLQKNAYPYLKDKPYLLPVSWVQRGYNLLTNGYAKKMQSVTAGTNSAKKEDIEMLQKLFEDLELM